MHSTTRTDTSLATLAGESAGAYDHGRDDPTARVLAITAQMEDLHRDLLDAWSDVAAWGGLPATQGWTGDEYLRIVARLPRRDARRLEQLTSRLRALPVTAALLRAGQISFEQAATICEATTRLTGSALAQVESRAAALAAETNVRGDDPDVEEQVTRLVDDHRRPAEIERAERRAVEGSRVVLAQDFDGGGRVLADLDPEAFSTVAAAVEHAAGTPTPDVPRRQQRAEGLVAMSRAWLTGSRPDGTASTAANARAAVVVHVDLADTTPSSFAQLVAAGTRGRAPRLSARLVDMLTCNADILLQIADGRRPLMELKDHESLPKATRRVILARDRGCRFPGCNAPPWMCDVHHLLPRSEGGTHDPQNLVVLCRRHHRRLHGSHWTATLDPTTAAFHLSRRRDGTNPLHTTYPNGTRPPPVPEPR